MNRSRRQPYNKQFVAGGIYDSHQNYGPPQPPRPLQKQQQQQIVEQAQQQLTPKPIQTPTAPVAQVEPQPIAEEVKIKQPISNPSVGESLVDESGKLQFKKIFVARKKSSVRVKEKKIRQNRQLRKAIFPKNALMALNEMKGVSICDCSIHNNADGSCGYTAVLTVNDKQYEGKGSTKIGAKNCACEKALRDYVLEKMQQRPRIPKTSTSMSDAGEPMDETPMCLDEGTVDGQKAGEEPNDDVPMINLASFAIYKLFAEWESEGYEVPELHPCASNGQSNGSENGDAAAAVMPKKPTIRTELPANWEAIHPATLLCLMRPGLIYTVCGTFGDKPNVMQRVSATVDGEEFVGTGRSKKTARRNVAVLACNKLFGTNFVQDEPIEA